jgi:hypothetical protein
MRMQGICFALALLAGAAVNAEANANGRLVWNGVKWVSSAIAGGVVYDTVKPDSVEAAPADSREPRAPLYERTPPMTDICIVPGVGSCPLPYPIPAGSPCRCY